MRYVSRTWPAKSRGRERPKRSKSRVSCARIANRESDGLALGRRQRRSPGIVARVIGDHALRRERPEHAPDIAFDGNGERRSAESVKKRRKGEKRGKIAVAPGREQLRLHVGERRAHPDQGGPRAHHD